MVSTINDNQTTIVLGILLVFVIWSSALGSSWSVKVLLSTIYSSACAL